jgi:hypothetical protein
MYAKSAEHSATTGMLAVAGLKTRLRHTHLFVLTVGAQQQCKDTKEALKRLLAGAVLQVA